MNDITESCFSINCDIVLCSVKDIDLVASCLDSVWSKEASCLIGSGVLCTEDAKKITELVILEHSTVLIVKNIYCSVVRNADICKSALISFICC